ncbi:MAG: VCBS repeat-containing protein [Opitutaceae bacterium]
MGIIVLLAAAAAYFSLRPVPNLPSRKSGESSGAGKSAVQKNPLDLNFFSQRQIGRPPEGIPWITDLQIVDLDADGLKDVIVCDGHLNKVTWIRQVRLGIFEEVDLGESIAGPAHVETADMNGDGHLDVLVASMGAIPPSNAKTGSVVVLVNDGTNHFTNRVLLENVARVTYVAAADLNKDGRLDLVVGQFGYIQGEIRWIENLGDWRFKSHPLLDLPGTIHAPVADMNGDGNLDIVALVSQDSEEVHFFEGDGAGHFRDRVISGSVNKDFGSSGLSIADINRDGKPDIAYTNGDGFDYATPGARPWHGVQWLENLGAGKFAFRRVGDFPGSYSPVIVDLNGDGHADIVACSGFNDWSNKDAISLICFENDGSNQFIPRTLAHEPTHLVVVKAADMFNDGRIQLVTGAFLFYPPYDRPSRVTLWEQKK